MWLQEIVLYVKGQPPLSTFDSLHVHKTICYSFKMFKVAAKAIAENFTDY